MRVLTTLILLLLLSPVFAEEQPIDPPGKKEMEWDGNDAQNFLPLGSVSREDILRLKVYHYNYIEYVPKSDPLEEIHNVAEPAEVVIYFGDWCKGCKKHVPALIKLMEFADNSRVTLKYVNMSPDKLQPSGLLEGKNITIVPTIIVLRGGTEIGRIVESPKEAMEEDLARILMSN